MRVHTPLRSTCNVFRVRRVIVRMPYLPLRKVRWANSIWNAQRRKEQEAFYKPCKWHNPAPTISWASHCCATWLIWCRRSVYIAIQAVLVQREKARVRGPYWCGTPAGAVPSWLPASRSSRRRAPIHGDKGGNVCERSMPDRYGRTLRSDSLRELLRPLAVEKESVHAWNLLWTSLQHTPDIARIIRRLSKHVPHSQHCLLTHEGKHEISRDGICCACILWSFQEKENKRGNKWVRVHDFD